MDDRKLAVVGGRITSDQSDACPAHDPPVLTWFVRPPLPSAGRAERADAYRQLFGAHPCGARKAQQAASDQIQLPKLGCVAPPLGHASIGTRHVHGTRLAALCDASDAGTT